MKIALISNWDIQCGNAEYARDLRKELEKEFTVVSMPGNMNIVKSELPQDAEVVIVNLHESRVNINVEHVRWMQSIGKKVVIILQNSVEQMSASDLLTEADAVVAHERVRFMNGDVYFQYIPHGIVEVPDLPAPYPSFWIGTAGFPFPWKRYDVVAEAAKKFGVRGRMIAPRSDQMETDVFMNGIAGHIHPLQDIHRGWLPSEQVIRMLAECTANIFWFESQAPCDTLGQSGSVRMGIAAKRPMIISRHRKFRTLLEYADEFYIADREEQVYEYLEEIFRQGDSELRKPNRIFAEMGWSVTGLKYRKLVKSL